MVIAADARAAHSQVVALIFPQPDGCRTCQVQKLSLDSSAHRGGTIGIGTCPSFAGTAVLPPVVDPDSAGLQFARGPDAAAPFLQISMRQIGNRPSLRLEPQSSIPAAASGRKSQQQPPTARSCLVSTWSSTH